MNSSNHRFNLDPFDALIFEKGLSIKKLLFDRDLDVFLVLLNNGKVIQLALHAYSTLANASEDLLNDYTLSKGGIHWPRLNEDISFRSILKMAFEQELSPTAVAS